MIENIGGLYAGEVVSLKDPEHRGRIKVKIAELLGEATSNWCEPCVPCCFENGGDFCLPELKDYVWVAFANGDLDTPVYLGGWWTKNSTPLGEEYKNKSDLRIIGFGDMMIEFNADKGSISFVNSSGEKKKTLSIGSSKVKIDDKDIDFDDKLDENSKNAIQNDVVAKKFNSVETTISNHKSDSVSHITQEERNKWNKISSLESTIQSLEQTIQQLTARVEALESKI